MVNILVKTESFRNRLAGNENQSHNASEDNRIIEAKDWCRRRESNPSVKRCPRKYFGLIIALSFFLQALFTSTSISQSQFTNFTQLGFTLEEVVKRQSLCVGIAYFGGHSILDSAQTSINPHAYIGGYGYESILAGAGISIQTTSILPVAVGFSAGAMAADFSTFFVGLNIQETFAPTKRTKLLLQGALAYQQKYDNNNELIGIYLKPPVWDVLEDDMVLVDKLRGIHLYVHSILRLRHHFLEPMIDLGWLLSRYSYSGFECDLGCSSPAGPASGNGIVSRTTFGLGLNLNLGTVELFAGFLASADAVAFPGHLVIKF